MVSDFDLSTTLRQVRRASQSLTRLGREGRDRAITAMAQALRGCRDELLEANTLDLEASRGQQGWVLEGMKLTPERLEQAAQRLEQLTLAPDPIGVIDQGWRTAQGDGLSRYRVPLGVIALVYEIYPEFAVQGLGMGLKTGNGLVMCSAETLSHTHRVMVERLSEAAYAAGIPEGAIQWVPADQVRPSDGEETRLPPLLQQARFVDLIIPCGRSSWVEAMQRGSSTPVLVTELSYGHLYVDESADWRLLEGLLAEDLSQQALDIGLTLQPVLLWLLIHPRWAECHLGELVELLRGKGIQVQADPVIRERVGGLDPVAEEMDPASLPRVRLQQVSGLQDGIQWINKNGSHGVEGILSDSQQSIQRFVQEVDAATIVVNQSPAQVQYPMDVLMPSSIQKLHARGPITLASLTTHKYVLTGQYLGSRLGR